MKHTRLTANLYLLDGAVNTGLLVSGRKGLLFDCCDTVTADRLARIGVEAVEMILCTQHRRPNTAGAYRFVEAGAELAAPAEELHLLTDPNAYWRDPRNRWHIYHHQPGPLVPVKSIPAARAVRQGDTIEWEGVRIEVLDTPGATDGSVSYLLETDGTTVCFSGDSIYGPGQMWDFHSLQKGCERMPDYHGFIGNKKKLIPSLEKLAACGADILVPSHGKIIRNPRAAIELLLARLDTIWRNYTSISCINHYFAGFFDDTKDDPRRMTPVATQEPPPFIRRVPSTTSFVLVSDTGAALLIDCGTTFVIDALQQWISDGVIKSLDACWITHYHDDHVDALHKLPEAFSCPIMTEEHMAEIIEQPLRFFLPCISPNGAPVARAVREGESWQWHEFNLTAFHFPGQTYYHSGLLVEGHGKRVFFAGDSGSPTGLDDHCCGNRNFLGAGKGFRRCMEIWRKHKPHYIFNQHQDRAFCYSDHDLDHMDAMLAERERLFAEVLPWPHPNFGIDENWVRAYPYEQEVRRGTPFYVDIQFTNHGAEEVAAEVEPVLPEGWKWDRGRGDKSIRVPPRTDGSVGGYCANPDKAARVWMTADKTVAPGQHVIPFRVTWAGRYMGQLRHAIVAVQ